MAATLEDRILERATVEQRIRQFPGWTFDGKILMRVFDFGSFPDAIHFVNRVAEAAEKLDHHPDFVIHYKRVTLTCSTHKHHAITEADLALLKEIEELV